ncbi:sushi, von Willebrand factor type A, EGF and pentraxin domain-containing protein 1 [Lingula anatina]|uniref:Sushi, von Willebrand factor type A, EGF and pentraxin domain-containing protein 1 n=1 Tax=Lingula anatina TaxID=7574 RepID=A0A1S3IQD7_LINAN|nr:sushi, von Willebrand factor type A, EGF and pentraxin domain-containing protein 1 [Lingula anatina]|eukprot:XP_013400283.2 sushi, von Willebrand factor type A, EGF and pentraxin domain-containing protein 1 [Lingula anatina]
MKAVLLLLVLCICANSAQADFGDAILSFVRMIIPGIGKGRGHGGGRWRDNDDYDQPEPPKTNMYVSVKESYGDRVYRLTSQPVQPSSWRQITRGNAISGDVSYFKGYMSSYRGFDSRIQINGASMYVSRSREPGTVRYELTECYVNGQKSSRVSTRGGCGGNGRVANNYEFYAFPGRLACEIPALNAHTSDRRSITDGLTVAISYTCTVGYRSVGGDGYIQCGDDGRWMGTPLQCEPIQCGRPKGILNGQVVGDSFTYRSTVSYECNQGYQLSASSSRVKQCNQYGEWIPSKDPECVPKSCNFPDDIQNGHVIGTDYTFGNVVSFSCDPDYKLVGAPQVRCTASGRWDDRTPTCELITCDRQAPPQNGRLVGSQFKVGTEIVFECREGYILVGPARISCDLDPVTNAGVRSSPSNPTCQKVSCPPPVDPENGNVRVLTDVTYGQEIDFECRRGFYLQGSPRATCQADGQWDSPPPTCVAMQCRDPGNVANANKTGSAPFIYGSTVSFTCETGSQLVGQSVLLCQDDGTWSSQLPTCEVIQCPVVKPPLNGAKNVDSSTHPVTMTFSCFPGYELDGQRTAQCQPNGQWSMTQAPACKVCPIGTYKEGMTGGQCQPCPARSSTSAEGSTSRQYCLCQDGSKATDTGECEEITCDPLEAPVNGSILPCGSVSDSQCQLTCDPGFILQGSRTRRCTATGWTGNPTTCTACPPNTYKSDIFSSSCLPCPQNSETTGLGTSLQSCTCKTGYQGLPGTHCQDVDECATNNGGCNQECHNSKGSYSCACSIPGYELDADGKTCVLNKTCGDIDEKPDNGFLECKRNDEYNGAVCIIKCDPGFFFVSGINNYITCGAGTDFVWSHQVVNASARIPACTREFFVDIQLPITFSYETRKSCNALPIATSEFTATIQEAINKFNVCRGLCEVQNLRTDCQDGSQPDTSEVRVSLSVLLRNPEENAVSPGCDSTCKRKNLREILGDSFALKNSIQKLVEGDSPQLQPVALSEFDLDTTSFTFSRPQMLCEKGRVFTKNRLCGKCSWYGFTNIPLF